VDVKNYIESGIIEAYVLGLATPQEVQEVDTLRTQHPEINKAINDFELSLEKYSQQNTTAVPDLKNKIWNNITETETPVIPIAQAKTEIPNHKELTAAPKNIKWLRGAIAASVILLLGSILLNFYYYGQFKSTVREVKAIESKLTTEQNKNVAVQTNLKMACDPLVRKISLSTNGLWSHCKATVFWDSRTNKVYLQLDEAHPMPSNQEFQLWAMKDGKPVNAGVVKSTDNFVLFEMNDITEADAFALTVENKSRTNKNVPDMANLHLSGKI
jgi:anti-sigma-K factor RskA